MPDVMTRADSVRLYYSGATSDGGAYPGIGTLSIGNFRSSTELRGLGYPIAYYCGVLTIEYAGGGNGPGTGTLTAVDANNVRWTPPGGTIGDPVTIANGETKLLEGGGTGGPTQYLRVKRESAGSISGTSSVALVDLLEQGVGFDFISVAQTESGANEYRCFVIKNVSAGSVNVATATRKLAADVTSNAGHLPASGGGTIGTSGSFADWSPSGFARNATTGEIVYYNARTATTLSVPSTGRALLGTTAAAGSAGHNVLSVPGIRLGIEAPTTQPGGHFATPATEANAPSGVTFSTLGTAGFGLAAGETRGLWLHRQIPAGMVASTFVLNAIDITLTMTG